MGRDKRHGFGYGMNEYEARENFREQLNRSYGGDTYCGGGEDITGWLKAICVVKPIPSTSPTKSKKVKVMSKAPGKLVNGFRITNETPDLLRLQLFAKNNRETVVPPTIEEFSLTIGEATKIAEEMAKKHNTIVHVLPARLWQDEMTKRLALTSRILEVSPVDGKEGKPGKWLYEVEVRI